MKAENPKSKRFGGGSMLGVCLTTDQREKLEKEAELAGLSLSEYTRRKLFGGRPIVASIRMPQNRIEDEKILCAGSRNFCSDTHTGQKYEMITLARESKHSEMPITHWVMSWPEEEHPTGKHVEQLVDIFLKEMGLEGHQVIYGLHGNTQNIHLHIAVNRMNEITGRHQINTE